MGTEEVLKILDDTATELLDKAKNKSIDESMDLVVASTFIMNKYLELKMLSNIAKKRTKKE